jgi:hypothetical protein
LHIVETARRINGVASNLSARRQECGDDNQISRQLSKPKKKQFDHKKDDTMMLSKWHPERQGQLQQKPKMNLRSTHDELRNKKKSRLIKRQGLSIQEID